MLRNDIICTIINNRINLIRSFLISTVCKIFIFDSLLKKDKFMNICFSCNSFASQRHYVIFLFLKQKKKSSYFLIVVDGADCSA